jgi:hypothetical protein
MVETGQSSGDESEPWGVPMELCCMVVGCTAVYGALFATGYWLYGNFLPAIELTALTAVCAVVLLVTWNRGKKEG